MDSKFVFYLQPLFPIPYSLILSVFDGDAWFAFDLQAGVGFGAEFLPVFSPVFDPIDPLIQPGGQGFGGFADLVPLQVEGVITVVVSLGIGWMGAVWDMAHRVDHKTGDERAIGIRADLVFADDLLGGQDDAFCGEGSF